MVYAWPSPVRVWGVVGVTRPRAAPRRLCGDIRRHGRARTGGVPDLASFTGVRIIGRHRKPRTPRWPNQGGFMADKATQLLLEALRRAVADPTGLPLYASKTAPGLFPATAAA